MKDGESSVSVKDALRLLGIEGGGGCAIDRFFFRRKWCRKRVFSINLLLSRTTSRLLNITHRRRREHSEGRAKTSANVNSAIICFRRVKRRRSSIGERLEGGKCSITSAKRKYLKGVLQQNSERARERETHSAKYTSVEKTIRCLREESDLAQRYLKFLLLIKQKIRS